jgi:hypothetical protein
MSLAEPSMPSSAMKSLLPVLVFLLGISSAEAQKADQPKKPAAAAKQDSPPLCAG